MPKHTKYKAMKVNDESIYPMYGANATKKAIGGMHKGRGTGTLGNTWSKGLKDKAARTKGNV